MSQAIVTIAYSDVAGFPAGSVVDHVAVSITNTTDSPPVSSTQNVAPGTGTVTFPNLDPGSYTYSISAQDASNSVYGTAVTGTFTISAPATVTLSIPATATVATA